MSFPLVSNGSNNSPNYQNLSLVAAAASSHSIDSDKGKAKFKDYINISGDKIVGELLEFEFKGERKGKRFVLDMGNGERVMITADNFPYRFNKAGKYTLELKTIDRGLISTLATKEIDID